MYSRPTRRTIRPIPGRLPATLTFVVGFALMTAAALFVGSAPIALGAGASAGAPAWTYVDIGVEYEQPGGPFCLVAGELPTAAPLPQAVELAVPASSTPQWVGEIYPSNTASDTQLPYKVSRRGTTDVYSLTLTGSRLGQVEALVPSLIAVSGSNYVVTLNWMAPGPADTCRIAVTLPSNAQILKTAEGAQLAIDSQGGKHYYRVVDNVKAGDTVSLNFTYTTPATTTETSTSGGIDIPLIWWIVGITAIVAVVLVIVVVRQNVRAATGPGDEGPGDVE